MNNANPVVIMDFSGIYQQEIFWKGLDAEWISVRDIPGTNCYCDSEAMERLREAIADFSVTGIHFIDSGNYHYMSRLWLEKIQEPFQLLVLDNHTDMQPPAFPGLLSCGGWIEAALTELPCLKHVILVGPDEAAYGQTGPKLRQKVSFCSRETLALQPKSEFDFVEEVDPSLPLYISLDKDVLCPGEAATTWSQGDMTVQQMLAILTQVWKRMEDGAGRILGVDICGECDPGELTGSDHNDAANRQLMEFLQNKGVGHEK
jgi:arginase family enzyme